MLAGGLPRGQLLNSTDSGLQLLAYNISVCLYVRLRVWVKIMGVGVC